MAQPQPQPQPQPADGQFDQYDPYNSISSSEFARAQERKAHGAGERRYGIFEALSAIEQRQRLHKKRHLATGSVYDFAAVAVLDDVIKLLTEMEQRAAAAYEFEVWVWMQECERVQTRVLPVSGGAQ